VNDDEHPTTPNPIPDPTPAAGSRQLGDMAGQAREIVDAAGDDVAAAAASAARLVQRAGVILEEELSSGLDALDRLEQRYVDVDRVRDPETFVLLSRFRSDAHQIVDLLIDVVGASLDGVGKLTEQGITIGVPLGRVTGPISGIVGGNGAGSGRSVNGGATGHAAVLESASPVAAGETARVSMAVTNQSSEETERFAVVASDLVSDGGVRIAGDRITIEPGEVTLAPGASERVSIVVAVPLDASPGRYAGLVQATQLDHVRAVLVITVT
jgi:hypothetical protein